MRLGDLARAVAGGADDVREQEALPAKTAFLAALAVSIGLRSAHETVIIPKDSAAGRWALFYFEVGAAWGCEADVPENAIRAAHMALASTAARTVISRCLGHEWPEIAPDGLPISYHGAAPHGHDDGGTHHAG